MYTTTKWCVIFHLKEGFFEALRIPWTLYSNPGYPVEEELKPPQCLPSYLTPIRNRWMASAQKRTPWIRFINPKDQLIRKSIFWPLLRIWRFWRHQLMCSTWFFNLDAFVQLFARSMTTSHFSNYQCFLGFPYHLMFSCMCSTTLVHFMQVSLLSNIN